MSAIGVIPILMALGVIVPDRPTGDPAPAWIPGLAGLLFVVGGIVVVTKTLVGGAAGSDGDLPRTAPRWLRAVYDLMVLMIPASLAAIASWIAFGPGRRHFSGSATFFGNFAVGETVGRVVFGFGAALTWFILVAFGVRAVRRWFSPDVPTHGAGNE